MCIFQGDNPMKKNIFAFMFGIVLFSSMINAEAVMVQPASKAMTYQNTVRSSAAKKALTIKKEKKPEVLPYKLTTVDLRSGASKNVTLIKYEELEIKVKEVEGYTWKVSYDTDCLSLIGNSAEDDLRTIRLKQKDVKDSSVFLDKRDSKGNTVENKAVYIKVH
jgi:hypothetical protein